MTQQDANQTSDSDRRRFHLMLAGAAALGVALALLLGQTTPLKAIEAFTADLRISLAGAAMAERDDITIIAIDEATLEPFPFRSPINRAFLADVVRDLDRRGAKVIALDILLDRPTVPEDDQALADALQSAAADIVLVTQPELTAGPAQACGPDGAALAAAPLADAFIDAGRTGDGMLCADGFDGVFRSLPDAAGERTRFADAIAEAAITESNQADARRPAAGPIRLGLGPRGGWPFPTYSARLVPALPDEWVAGRIVLIGAITPWDDLHVTPLRYAQLASPVEPLAAMPDDMVPGVVVHAYLVAQRLDGAAGPRLRGWRELFLALAGAAIAIAIAISPRSPWTKAAALAGVLAAYWLLAWLAFAAFGLLLGLGAFSLALVLTAGLATAADEHFQRAQKTFIRHAFEHYLAPPVVRALIRNPSELALAAHERELSVLFCDIESFTRFVDSHTPPQVTAFMNDYFDRLIDVVHAHGGTVDKIMGDSLDAFFSAPLTDDQHRERCVRCALAIDKAAQAVRARHQSLGGAPGITRVGAHSGRALVGNFGGEDRFNYTALGSTMNLAARLENANKTLGTRVCVSAAARVEASGLAYRTIGRVQLRGFAEAFEVFEPVDATTADLERLKRYEAAIAMIRLDPDAAGRDLAALLAETGDPLVAFQLNRLEGGTFGKVIKA